MVSGRGEFLGGVLAPGIEISVDALAARAAQLRKVELVKPPRIIGKNTVECLQSGVVYGFAGQVDGVVRGIIGELGGPVAAGVAPRFRDRNGAGQLVLARLPGARQRPAGHAG